MRGQSKLKIGVIGASGFVGGYARKSLRGNDIETIGTWYKHPEVGLVQLDVSDKVACEMFLRKGKFDAVIVTAAQANVDWCENHAEESYYFNTLPMANLASIMNSSIEFASIHLIFVSTDYVFDGENGPYTEKDIPNPLNVYGAHKLEAEKHVLSVGGTVVRTTWVYGYEKNPKNFVARLVQQLREGNTVKVPVDQISSPTYVEDLAKGLVDIALSGLRGLYHVSEVMSRYDFAQQIVQQFRLEPVLIKPVYTADLGQVARRPLKSGLISIKNEKNFDYKPRSVKRGLEETYRKICDE